MHMNAMIKHILAVVFLLITFCGNAQEKLNGLQYQPQTGKWLLPKNDPKMLLPFLEDFSRKYSAPDPSKWIDNEVFINNDYPLEPSSYGVATLDAVDADGNFYEGAGPFLYEADHLTSVFVDLSSLSPADSLYFSFRYQPQGKGNAPEESDSLVVQFLEIYRADTLIDTTVVPPVVTYIDQWRNVWSAKGSSVDSFYVANQNRYFKQVMIPLTDPLFFRADFRFRFVNYASLASNNIPSWQSNCDQWNVDLVYFNSGRTYKDTLFNDMCFVNSAPSLLRQYTAMPFRQFAAAPEAEMQDSVRMQISNLGQDILISRYRFRVHDMAGSEVYAYDGGNFNLDPFYISGYQTYKPHAVPNFESFAFPVNTTDSVSFYVDHNLERIGATQELIRSNDSIRYHQQFLNFYAYDDGIPEMGYGLSPSGSQMAYGFHINVEDTLKGVLIAFNKTLSEANLKNFYLALYKSNAGKPGDLIYRNLSARKAAINDTSLFSYYEYDSDEPIILKANTSYFIGIIQTTDDNLNIGYDINHDASAHLFFNVDGTWNPTAFSGAPMLRPVIGPSYQYGSKISPAITRRVLIYPNPSQGDFRIMLPGNEQISDYQLRVYSLNGQRVADQPAAQHIQLDGISNGLYFVELQNRKSGQLFREKVLLQQ